MTDTSNNDVHGGATPSNTATGPEGKTIGDWTDLGREMWSYLAAVSQVARNPFGNNPHALVA